MIFSTKTSLYFPLILIALLILCAGSPTAQMPEDTTERYNEAGALYRAGDFGNALTVYEKLIESGISNPDLYYNASNAAYRIGSLGTAILFLERARRLAPSDKDILANLAYLNSVKTDQETEQSNVVLAFLSRCYDAVNVNAAALWSGIAFAAALILATGALYVAGWKRLTLLPAALVCLLVFFTATGALVQKAHRQATIVEAVVLAEEAPAYSGPGIENTHIFTLHEGTKVTIEREQDTWSLIRLGSGAGGWIKADLMERI